MSDHDKHGNVESLTPEELEEQFARIRLERDRLELSLVQREALLMAAARKLRRFVPNDPVVRSIARLLGDDET